MDPKMDQESDEALMQKYQEGDQRAFEQIYQRYSGKVYAFVLAGLRDRAAADDTFQSIWMKFHRTRSRYLARYPLAPWIFTLSRSVLIDGVRKRKRIQEDSDTNAVESAPAIESEEARAELDLSLLPEKQKHALQLRYQDGLSFEEIAVRFHTSPMNVRQIVSRAVKKMKTLISAQHRSKS